MIYNIYVNVKYICNVYIYIYKIIVIIQFAIDKGYY